MLHGVLGTCGAGALTRQTRSEPCGGHSLRGSSLRPLRGRGERSLAPPLPPRGARQWLLTSCVSTASGQARLSGRCAESARKPKGILRPCPRNPCGVTPGVEKVGGLQVSILQTDKHEVAYVCGGETEQGTDPVLPRARAPPWCPLREASGRHGDAQTSSLPPGQDRTGELGVEQPASAGGRRDLGVTSGPCASLSASC